MLRLSNLAHARSTMVLLARSNEIVSKKDLMSARLARRHRRGRRPAVGEVPVDGFWSISVVPAQRYSMESGRFRRLSRLTSAARTLLRPRLQSGR
jgi:hypothetical protein